MGIHHTAADAMEARFRVLCHLLLAWLSVSPQVKACLLLDSVYDQKLAERMWTMISASSSVFLQSWQEHHKSRAYAWRQCYYRCQQHLEK